MHQYANLKPLWVTLWCSYFIYITFFYICGFFTVSMSSDWWVCHCSLQHFTAKPPPKPTTTATRSRQWQWSICLDCDLVQWAAMGKCMEDVGDVYWHQNFDGDWNSWVGAGVSNQVGGIPSGLLQKQCLAGHVMLGNIALLFICIGKVPQISFKWVPLYCVPEDPMTTKSLFKQQWRMQ